MNNVNGNQGMQKRMLIMTLVVFVFFIAYEFLVLKPQQEAKAAQAAQEKKVEKQAPTVATSSNPTSAPQASEGTTPSNVVDALSTKTIAPNDIVTTITTNKNVIEIEWINTDKYNWAKNNSNQIAENVTVMMSENERNTILQRLLWQAIKNNMRLNITIFNRVLRDILL